jgi:hypothetical protein
VSTLGRAEAVASRATSGSNGQHPHKQHDPADHSTVGIAELLEILNDRHDEFVAVCHQKHGGPFRASIMPPNVAPRYVATLGDTVNIWAGVNPTAGPARADAGRGTAEQTTRLAALYADLDVKPGACADIATAETIIDELSARLGQRPTIVVASGHGLQPYWPVDDGEISDTFSTTDAAVLLHRFGRLAELVADRCDAKVDNVFEAARVLRVPGSVNWKSDPVPVTARRDTGGPLTVGEVDDRLDELGIYRQVDDTNSEPLSDPGGWLFAEQTCPYVAKWISELATDGPLPGKGRNPWACSQAVRLHCAWMLGCINEADFIHGGKLLEQRLAHLLASTEPRRRLRELEMRDAFKLGRQRASCKTVEQAAAELGGHTHTPQEPPLDVDDHHAGEYNPDEDTSPETDAPETDHDTEPTTWEAFDLGPWLRGEIERAEPSTGVHRADGLQLVYLGRENAVLGETESGKTWFALGCVAAELAAGNHVVYIHYEESDPGSTIEKLRLLGVADSLIRERLHFVAPARAAHAGWIDALLDPPPALVVHDGVNEAMALHGTDIMAADGASAFRRRLILPCTRAGAATLACDHLPMVRDGARRDAYGSVHKGNALDGARILLENTAPFGRRMRGVSYVFVTKDRPGHLRGHGRPTKTPGKTFMGTLVVDDSETFSPDFSMRFFAPQEDDDTGADSDPSAELADIVYDVAFGLPDHTVASGRLLLAEVRKAGHQIRTAKFWDAVDDLIVNRRLVEVEGKRGARGFQAAMTDSQEPSTGPIPGTASGSGSPIGGEPGTTRGKERFPVPGNSGNHSEPVEDENAGNT